jgi:hypothetical protein
MRIQLLAVCAALFMAFPVVAGAQAPASAVSLADPDPPGWDAFGHVAWLTVDKRDIAPDWNSWYDVATFGGSVGRFVGRHVKLEFDAATSSHAEIYTEEMVSAPPTPFFVSRQNRFRMTTLSAGASYQFFDNRWFHPVIGGGIESGRETRRIETMPYPFRPPVVVPALAEGTSTTWRTRPFVTTGFKAYVAERAFIRSDVRTTFDGDGVGQVSWRTGVGFDF